MQGRRFSYDWCVDGVDYGVRIEKAQQVTEYVINGQPYARLKLGQGDEDPKDEDECCGDCGIEFGQYHLPGCDMETCPCCKGQVLSCACFYDEHDVLRYGETGEIVRLGDRVHLKRPAKAPLAGIVNAVQNRTPTSGWNVKTGFSILLDSGETRHFSDSDSASIVELVQRASST